MRGALAGRVAIGLPPTMAKVLTVPLTRAFRVQMPDAALAISEGLTVAMRESLTTGLLDIALLYNTPASPGIEITPLLEEDLFLVQRRPVGQSDAEADAQARQPERPAVRTSRKSRPKPVRGRGCGRAQGLSRRPCPTRTRVPFLTGPLAFGGLCQAARECPAGRSGLRLRRGRTGSVVAS